MLNYDESGAGQPLLLIHGLAGTGQSHFAPLIAALRDQRRVIVPDLRGHGRSAALPLPRDASWFSVHVADLLQLVDALRLEQVDIVGYSDGAEIALLLAAALGVRARSVTAWGISGQVPPPAVVSIYADPARSIPNWPAFRAELLALHGSAGPAILSAWAAAMQALAAQGGSIIGAASIQNIACPVLLISGDRDPFNPLINVQQLAQRLPTATLLVLSGAGHDLLAERPAQLLTLIQRMLSQ